MGLNYHHGQIEVQEEANTRRVADMLADWVGPVAEFALCADLFVLSSAGPGGELRFRTLSGKAPLVEVAGPGTLRFSGIASAGMNVGVATGGLAISLPQLRRARINGSLRMEGDDAIFEADEAFTNCRKYIVPSVAVEDGRHAGPAAESSIGTESTWLRDVLNRAQTSFLASMSPDGLPDVSHRGGPAGFLRLNPESRTLSWDEYVGDGMMKSAGNVRATGRVTLLVLDLESGDAAEIGGRAEFRTLRTAKEARTDPLQRHGESFPVQGQILLNIESCRRLQDMVNPRRVVQRPIPVTSASSIDDQAPQ
jgi:hypothetical protein